MSATTYGKRQRTASSVAAQWIGAGMVRGRSGPLAVWVGASVRKTSR